MQNFAKWYLSLLQTIFSQVLEFFSSIGNTLGKLFINSPQENFKMFIDASQSFTLLDWIGTIVVITLNIIFIVVLLILLYKLIRRYIRFVRKEINTDNLLSEIGHLNKALIESSNEKNAILSLTSSQVGGPFSDNKLNGDSELDSNESNKNSRFVKLIDVDETYDFAILPTNMSTSDEISLQQLIDQFINFSASTLGLFYTHNLVAKFLASMASSKIIILEGISGTGKTSLPYAFGKFFNNDSTIISVQPSWNDRTELIGYLNDFTKTYSETDFLKSIYETTFRTDVNLIILDEMNLARVEYYFADFLSIMEMPDPKEWLIDVISNQVTGDPVNLKKGKLLLPQNVWFIGTANRDDSTFTITDKVYDRAGSLEMNERAKAIDAPLTNNINISYEYLDKLFKEAIETTPISKQTLQKLETLDLFITNNFQITFGNRIMRQIKSFLPVYIALGQDEIEGLDFLVARKVIRKFETLNIAYLMEEFNNLEKELDILFGKKGFLQTRKLIEQYRKQV